MQRVFFFHLTCKYHLHFFNWVWVFYKLIHSGPNYFCHRKQPSYFDQPPPHTNINTGGLNYERSCPCDETKDKGKKKNECVDGIPVYVPDATNDKLNRIKMCDRNPQKRDVEGSDDLTDEDFALFRDPSDNKLVRRMKRSITPVSKDNATRYCAEKLAETQVGKLCAKLGANIQALVNVCSSDIEVSNWKLIFH